MEKIRIYAKARPEIFYLGIVFFIFMFINVMYKDFVLHDYSGGIYYEYFGYIIYPISYILSIFSITYLILIVRKLNVAISVDFEEKTLNILKGKVKISDISSIKIEKGPMNLGLSLVIYRKKGSSFFINSVFIKGDINSIADNIRSDLDI